MTNTPMGNWPHANGPGASGDSPKASGATTKRPEPTQCRKGLNAGDVLTVWTRDRLGRALRHLLGLSMISKRGPWPSSR
jgi:DNA invertase Pin-like site-specific DNA recombinase